VSCCMLLIFGAEPASVVLHVTHLWCRTCLCRAACYSSLVQNLPMSCCMLRIFGVEPAYVVLHVTHLWCRTCLCRAACYSSLVQNLPMSCCMLRIFGAEPACVVLRVNASFLYVLSQGKSDETKPRSAVSTRLIIRVFWRCL
jgi:hypothetical protein